MTPHAPISNLHSQERSEGKQIKEASFSLCYWATARADGENIQQRPVYPAKTRTAREEEVKHCTLGLCHVTFCSSVNVVDYSLRDQNWLPGIGPPSISAESGAQAGAGPARPARAHGMQTAWSRCLNR